MHHHRQTIALMAGHFGRSTQWRKPAFRFFVQNLHAALGIGDRIAGAIHYPARRHGAFIQIIHLHLARRRGGGRHIQDEGQVAPGGCGKGDGIGAEHGLGAARWHHGHAACRAGHQANRTTPRRDTRINTRRAEMMRIAHTHHAKPGFLRHIHGQIHAIAGNRMPKPSTCINQRRTGGAAFNYGARIDLQLAFLQALFIGHQHGNAVTIHTE